MSNKYNKHQILPNQEAQWKLEYLTSKFNQGENITHFIEPGTAAQASAELFNQVGNPQKIEEWINQFLNPKLKNKLSQAIRKRRKRFFDKESFTTAKKTVELEYSAWEVLSKFAKELNLSLSDALLLMNDLTDNQALSKFKENQGLVEDLDEDLIIDLDNLLEDQE